MKILEVRDGFIRFESNKFLDVSSFIQIDSFKRYVAQIIKINLVNDVYVGYAKLLYIYEGALCDYDGTLPDKTSDIAPISFEIINNLFERKLPVISGHFVQDDIKILLNKSSFDKKMLVSLDTVENFNRLIKNFEKEFLRFGNVLIIDMLGVLNGKKFVASKDFKIPFNTDALKFLYEDCLDDVTSDSKALIKEIFSDLAEYSKTVSNISFSMLKNVIDDMVNNSHIFKLLALKNKLSLYERMNYFSSTEVEAKKLEGLLSQKNIVLDLSKLDANFQNRYLNVIYSILNKTGAKPQILLLASNAITKKSLKNVLVDNPLATTFLTISRFKYMEEIKTLFKNFIIEPNFGNNNVFSAYKTFLSSITKDFYLMVSEDIGYIPLISSYKEIEGEPIEIDVENCENETNEGDEDLIPVVEKDEKTIAIDKKLEVLAENVTTELNNEVIEEEILIFDDQADEQDSEPVEENVEADNDDILETITVVAKEETEEILSEEIAVSNEEIEEVELISESLEELAEEEISEEVINQEEAVDNDEEIIYEEISMPDDIAEIVLDSDIVEDDEVEISESTSVEEDNDNTEDVAFNENEIIIENQTEDFQVVSEDENLQEDEIIELDGEDVTPDILISIDDIEEINLADDEDLDKEINEDVDKVYTTMKEDVITDSDLDFIDELNDDLQQDVELNELEDSNFEELPQLVEEDDEDFSEPLEEVNEYSNFEQPEEEKEFLETRNNTTPTIPVYDADIPQEDMVLSDNFEQGDAVSHAKYGTGVVEKMVKYGTKNLYLINFDNTGRKLLDPTVTEIKKI